MPTPPTGHDAASYRAARQAKKQRELEKQEKQAMRARLIASQPLIQEVVREAREKPKLPQIPQPRPASSTDPFSPGTGRRALSREIILEHTDEDDDDSVF
jgi:hypothetical protein